MDLHFLASAKPIFDSHRYGEAGVGMTNMKNGDDELYLPLIPSISTIFSPIKQLLPYSISVYIISY